MTDEHFDLLLDSFIHFEFEAGYPLAMQKEKAKVLKKYLPDYVEIGKSEFADRPSRVTKKKNAKISPEIELLFYKQLYQDYLHAYNDIMAKTQDFIKRIG